MWCLDRSFCSETYHVESLSMHTMLSSISIVDTYPAWSSLSILDSVVSYFWLFLKILHHYALKYFFCFVFSLLLVGFKLHMLEHVNIVLQLLDALFFFLFSHFFPIMFKFWLFLWTSLQVHWFFLQLCQVYWWVLLSQKLWSVSDFILLAI